MVKIELSDFTLTNDMVPIHFLPEGFGFICPLPKKYMIVLNASPSLYFEVKKIKEIINQMAKGRISPFENIMLGCCNETETIIEDILFYNSELRSIVVSGFTIGDVYLNTDSHLVCDPCIIGIDYFFEERKTFLCHNIDFYWQALLCRELVVRYFNLLNGRLKSNKKD
ncbi:MAG: hypothetical protein WC472_04080 [Candidatus Paceibacterota bacterium]